MDRASRSAAAKEMVGTEPATRGTDERGACVCARVRGAGQDVVLRRYVCKARPGRRGSRIWNFWFGTSRADFFFRARIDRSRDTTVRSRAVYGAPSKQGDNTPVQQSRVVLHGEALSYPRASCQATAISIETTRNTLLVSTGECQENSHRIALNRTAPHRTTPRHAAPRHPTPG